MELVGQTKGWRTGATLSVADPIDGSPLSLSMVASPNMNIFYVDASTKNIFSVSYDGGWKARKHFLPQNFRLIHD